MTTPEVKHALADYFARFGAATVHDLRLALRCQCSEAQVRAALKALRAHGRKFGHWDRWHRDDPRLNEAIAAHRSANPKCWNLPVYHDPDASQRFTLYRLTPWETGSMPA